MRETERERERACNKTAVTTEGDRLMQLGINFLGSQSWDRIGGKKGFHKQLALPVSCLMHGNF